MLRCVPKLRFSRAITSLRQSQMWCRRTFSSSKPPPVISRNDDARKQFHIAGARPRQLPEFEFLYSTQKFDTRALSFKKKIATVADQNIVNNMPVKTVKALLETAKASLVGKNEQTVLDETARKSHEILAAQIQLELSFRSWFPERSRRWRTQTKSSLDCTSW